MGQKLVKPVLEQNILFAKDYHVFSSKKKIIHDGQFVEVGCHAVDIRFTDGNNQVFTTKDGNPNVFGSYEFETDQDFFDYVEYLKRNDVKRK